MFKRGRFISQIVFFILFLFFFFFAGKGNSGQGLSNGLAWFLRLNPFNTVITTIASRSIVMPYVVIGILMIIVTVLFSRIFCGAVCPLGSIIDFTDYMLREKVGATSKWLPPLKLQGLKYIFLFVLIILAVGGMVFPLFMDPLLLITRIFTLLVRPFLLLLLKPFGAIGVVDKIITSPVVLQGAYAGTLATCLLFILVLAGSFFDKRFWCQYICPSGAFFGLMSRYSIFTRRTKSAMCNNCGVCTLPCPTRAITEGKGGQGRKTSLAECIMCGLCSADKESCGSYKLGPMLKDNEIVQPDLNRRHLVSGVLAGLLLTPVLAGKSSKKKPFVPGPIRPPGAVEEDKFLARCIACDACISVCPQNALHPCTIGKDGFGNWNTPKLVPRIGFCEEECTKCSEACPTGALLPITPEEKKKISIGTAYVERGLCRSWRQRNTCTICADKCPYDAIDIKEIVDENGKVWKVPIVNKRKCTGCGICEYYCPEKSGAAIKVSAYGVKTIERVRKRLKRSSKA